MIFESKRCSLPVLLYFIVEKECTTDAECTDGNVIVCDIPNFRCVCPYGYKGPTCTECKLKILHINTAF